MTATEQAVVTRLASEWGDGRPAGYVLGADELPVCRCAIYAAYDVSGTCRYVGSVARQSPRAVIRRSRKHLTEPVKWQRWDTLWVVSLMPTTPRSTVRRLEARVALELHPADSSRHPRPW